MPCQGVSPLPVTHVNSRTGLLGVLSSGFILETLLYRRLWSWGGGMASLSEAVL